MLSGIKVVTISLSSVQRRDHSEDATILGYSPWGLRLCFKSSAR